MIVFESIALDLIALLAFLCIAVYYYLTRNFNFWEKHGVAYVKPIPFLGSLKDVIFQKYSIGHKLKLIYEEYKGEPYVGIFSNDKPGVVLRDLDIVKNVLVKDSQNFVDHLVEMDEDLDPLTSRGLLVLKGQKWRHMRNQLSPTFTSGKMKNMFHLVETCAKELDKYLDASIARGSSIEIKEVTAKFTTDVIASCAFGIDSNTLKDPNAEFRKELKKVFEFTPLRALGSFLAFFAPQILKVLRIQIIDSSVVNFVRSTLWETAKYRQEKGIVRRDFVDTLTELRKNNMAKEDNGEPTFKFSDDDYAAQAFAFLTAGFETSSSTISFTLYQLALHPELQEKLRAEIKVVLAKHNNEVTYDGIQEMKYLEMIINETLRLYPTLPFLDRKCLSDYEFPAPSGKGTVTIPAGTGVYIPLIAIQNDPEYFPQPEKYDPERFTEENKQTRSAFTHMPFGEGPRICIGMRFGKMQTKTGLIHILSRYEVSPCKETPIPLVLDQKSFLLATTTGIPLTFKPIHT